jgi:hypothetical protein
VKATIGRNDLCPCGSGKKYKKCCLALDQKRARQIRNLDSPTQWMQFYWEKITGQMSPLIADQIDVITQRWGTPLAQAPYLPHLHEHALLDAGQHEAQIKGILSEGDTPLDERLDNLVSSLMSSHLTCYEVTACRRGEYIELADRISGSNHTVYDADLSQRLEPMEAFIGRLISHEDAALLLPGWLKLKFWYRKKVFASVTAQYETMGANLDDEEEMHILLKRQPELIMGALLEFDALSPQPVI